MVALARAARAAGAAGVVLTLRYLGFLPDIETGAPFLGTWRRVYTAVLAWLALLIAAFYVFTRVFSS